MDLHQRFYSFKNVSYNIRNLTWLKSKLMYVYENTILYTLQYSMRLISFLGAMMVTKLTVLHVLDKYLLLIYSLIIVGFRYMDLNIKDLGSGEETECRMRNFLHLYSLICYYRDSFRSRRHGTLREKGDIPLSKDVYFLNKMWIKAMRGQKTFIHSEGILLRRKR